MKRIISFILLLTLMTSTSAFAANDASKDEVVIEKNKEEKEISKLLEKAIKEDAKKDSNTKKDENGNKIYSTKQLLSKVQKKDGSTEESYVTTSFHKVEVPEADVEVVSLSVPGNEVADGEWDSSYSGYVWQRVYYDELTINGASYVSMKKIDGEVHLSDTFVSVDKIYILIRQEYPVYDQTEATTYYNTLDFTHTVPTDWDPAYQDRLTSSYVKATFRFGSETWTQSVTILL